MIIPNPRDAVHKAWLYRLLTHFCDNVRIAHFLYFKGGTCAAMLGWLDRFSIDLDFDFMGTAEEMPAARKAMEAVFADLGLEIKDASSSVPQYFLKYPAPPDVRDTVKIDVTFPPPRANIYEPTRFIEIDRIFTSQTVETMFANKLVAIIDRYEKTGAIAGRDLYDIHYFFLTGRRYNEAVIAERTGKEASEFLQELIGFIDKRITETVLAQDLNVLLPYDQFRKIRHTIKQEALMFLRDEASRISRK